MLNKLLELKMELKTRLQRCGTFNMHLYWCMSLQYPTGNDDDGEGRRLHWKVIIAKVHQHKVNFNENWDAKSRTYLAI